MEKERDKKGRFVKGHKTSQETREKIRKKLKGIPLSEEHKKKIKKNNAHYWQDKYLPEKMIQKLRDSHIGHPKPANAYSFPTGKDNPNFKGGITPENHKIRSSIEIRLWREAVFARDAWTCQKCGSMSEKGKAIYLHSHHIKNFAEYPELRFAIDNGITFCKKCHDLFHKIYGRRNNTKEQLEEFLDSK